jgi:hypothetical protein
VVFWAPAKKFLLLSSCEKSGGKWATNGNYCIQRSCAEDRSCKPSYQNNGVCSKLSTGITSDELYFELGMPESIDGNTYSFAAGGGGWPIKATIIDGVVTHLDCGLHQ